MTIINSRPLGIVLKITATSNGQTDFTLPATEGIDLNAYQLSHAWRAANEQRRILGTKSGNAFTVTGGDPLVIGEAVCVAIIDPTQSEVCAPNTIIADA
jgi:hypothetical protein